MRALVVLVLLSCVLTTRAGTEEIKAKAAAARAAISDEELARQIRENTMSDTSGDTASMRHQRRLFHDFDERADIVDASVFLSCSSTDADLLPTRGPAKAYTPTGAPEFGLLLTPGIGKGCNLKKFPNLRSFLKNEAKF